MAFLVYADAKLMDSNRTDRYKTKTPRSNSSLSHTPLAEVTNVLDLKPSCCLACIILLIVPLKSTKHFRQMFQKKKKIQLNAA